jgi:glycosyltransferase involved in cell wall biosynthesis
MFDIVMPLFNKGSFVGPAIESVLAQSFGDWRLFVVDDGSSDDGPAVVERFRDRRICLLRQANAGPAPARNAGIARGSADWIALLDSDDLWLPDHLAELVSLRRHFPGSVLIGTAYKRWDGQPQRTRVPAASRRASLIRYFARVAQGHSPFFTSSAAFSRAAMAVVGPFQPAMVGEDTDLWARLALHGPVAASTLQTVLYRVTTGGLTDQYVANKTEIVDAMRLEDVALPVATVVQRLPEIDDARLRDDLERYVDHEVGVALLRALVAGRQSEARKLLSLFLRGPHGKGRAAALLTRLPWPWGRRILFGIFRIKSGLRSAAARIRG